MRTLSQVLSLDPLTRLRSGKPSLPSGPTPSGSTPTTRPCVSLSVMRCSFSRNSRQPIVTAITALRDSRRPSRCDTSPPSDSIAFCSRSRERSGNPGRVVADEAGLEIAFDLVGFGAGRFVGQAPDRVVVEIADQRLGRAREADVAPRHVRGHVGDQVVGAERGLQEVLQRLADHHRVAAVDVIRVQEHHEHAPPRVGDHRVALGDRRRVAARQADRLRGVEDRLEGADGLDDAVLLDLEVGLGQVGDRLAVGGHEDVGQDEAGVGPEGGGLGRRRLRLLSSKPPTRPRARQDADPCGNHE